MIINQVKSEIREMGVQLQRQNSEIQAALRQVNDDVASVQQEVPFLSISFFLDLDLIVLLSHFILPPGARAAWENIEVCEVAILPWARYQYYH